MAGARKSSSAFVSCFHFFGVSSQSCSSSRSCVCFLSPLWMPEKTMMNLYPTSAALAMTAVKLVVFPDCTYPTTSPFASQLGALGGGV
ncbi:hypothetical protein [Gordonia paraffinivorans]|uniref:hypothetical protein n=1 Tax=Gordonia paraffinivorans TaxID=175628 RepID=UPI0014457474|nr:hypothetical protein [Gordonia paraffinivorans]